MDEINVVHDRTVTSKYRPDYDFSGKHHRRYRDQHVAKRSSKSAKSWWNSPETKRKKRVARYKLYAVEGKVKSSIKKGLCWEWQKHALAYCKLKLLHGRWIHAL
ncbi:hypothetical protein NC651_029596 [Populus alba x Populus x berolinensis]|nr:hypothetical protein NC651_029596 [Populus alba x Populus x berolinensis]